MATLEDLTIHRIIAHEVVLASALNRNQEPLMSSRVSQLDQAGLQLVARRVAEALGMDSHSIQVDITDSSDGSAFRLASMLLDSNDDSFVTVSQRLANKLSQAQNVGSIKPGIALIFQGAVGSATQRHRLIVIVKAESDSAFIKKNLQTGVSLEFVREMVLGAQQRLFKIAAFIELRPSDGAARNPADFETLVYDHQMNIKGAGQAAQYFYSTFLGASISPGAPELTKRFFEATTAFINESTRSRTEKWELKNHLTSYLRSNEATISARTFGERFLGNEEERRAYHSTLREAGLAGRSIPKDTRFIDAQLKVRRLTFSNRIQLSGPSDAFAASVTVDETQAPQTIIRIAATVVDDR